MNYLYNDGGRTFAGFKPHYLYKGQPAGDCVVRAISIACDVDYGKVNKLVKALFRVWDKKLKLKDPYAFTSWQAHGHGAQSGVPRYIYEPFLRDLGFDKLPRLVHGIRRVSDLAKLMPNAPTARLALPWLPPEHSHRLQYPGVYLVTVREHIACVRDGDLHDLVDCRQNRVYVVFAKRREMTQDLRDYFNG